MSEFPGVESPDDIKQYKQNNNGPRQFFKETLHSRVFMYNEGMQHSAASLRF
ncbi:hypothetical protein [Chitinophaga sp.]|uniref:hypothetical protein n=1 Tax=Chitinophaga sp. TaxID=1869181 RepID=UPI002F951397